MGSNNRRSRVKGTSTLASASAIVTQMQTELHGLIARQQELTRRIRSVHRVVRGLREMASTRAFNPLPTKQLPLPADSPIASQSEQNPPADLRPALDPASIVLQRACRIALMEAGTAVSFEDIHERIVRRGSFSFVDINHARLTLNHVLEVMTHAGEIRILESSPNRLWERIPQAKEL